MYRHSGHSDECQVIISTALNDIYGPRDEVKRLYNSLNVIEDKNSLSLIDCRRVGRLSSIKFTVDDVDYDVQSSDYILRLPTEKIFKNETCYLSILPADNYHPRQWILGTNFLLNSYYMFDMDNRRVGIVEAVL